MKIYKLEWADDFHGNCIEWHATKKEAEQAMKEISPTTANKKVIFSKVSLPENKQGIIDWLNVHLTRDND